jgi:hypothetical protein
MRNTYIGDDITESEKMGSIEDYSLYKEQRDLENYKIYMNCSDADQDTITVKKTNEQGKVKRLVLDKK